MKLRDYLHFNRIKHKDFAHDVGCSVNHMNLIIQENRIPSKILAKLIEKETNGEVTFEELMQGENKY